MTEKTWEIKVISKDDNSVDISRTNQGFSVFELLGIVKLIEKSLVDFLQKGQVNETLYCNDKELRKGDETE